jgi:hypothetical protein
MNAWVLGDPEELTLVEKPVPVPVPGPAEVLVRVDAIAVCATDIEILKHGLPAMVDGGLPFNRGFTPGHEYMGTVVRLGPTVDEFQIGDRIAVEVHAGCGRCQRCREGMYTSCLNYGYREKGHRANGYIYVFGIRGEGKSATHRAAALMAQKPSMRRLSKHIPSRSPRCRPPDMPATASRTRSRSSLKFARIKPEGMCAHWTCCLFATDRYSIRGSVNS